MYSREHIYELADKATEFNILVVAIFRFETKLYNSILRIRAAKPIGTFLTKTTFHVY